MSYTIKISYNNETLNTIFKDIETMFYNSDVGYIVKYNIKDKVLNMNDIIKEKFSVLIFEIYNEDGSLFFDKQLPIGQYAWDIVDSSEWKDKMESIEVFLLIRTKEKKING